MPRWCDCGHTDDDHSVNGGRCWYCNCTEERLQPNDAPVEPRPGEALTQIATLRTDGSRSRCQYCESDAGGGLYSSGEKLSHHEPWCPSVLACKALGLSRLYPEPMPVHVILPAGGKQP